MAEDRMLNDEILLGLIKANSGGGGGGTTNYNLLSNKPQIAGTELQGNKTLADLGIASAQSVSNITNGESINNFAGVETALDGVATALATKQNATDNSLETEAKTIVGAINEHEGDIASLKSGFTNLDNEVNGDATVYPYADVITIDDAVPSNLADCSVKIEPVQDLHGYDKPWVGGAGKNKLPLVLADIKANNTDGTWSGDTYTLNGVSFTILKDADGNVTGVKTGNNQTATGGNASFNIVTLSQGVTLDSGQYIGNGCPANGSSSTYYIRFTGGFEASNEIGEGTGVKTVTTSAISVYIRVTEGATVSDLVFTPMIRLATESDATFAPYTNICPITGHTEASVQRDGVNRLSVNSYSGSGMYLQSTTFKVLGAYVHRNLSFTGNGVFNFKLFGIKNGIETTIDEAGYSVSFNDIRNNVSQYDHIRVSGYSSDASNNLSQIMLAFSDTDTPLAYEPYAGKTYTIALGDTIYGGKVRIDSNGNTVMDVDRAIAEYDGSEDESWNMYGAGSASDFAVLGVLPTNAVYSPRSSTIILKTNYLESITSSDTWGDYNAFISQSELYVGGQYFSCGIKNVSTSVEAWKTYLASNPLQVCYELATPTTIQLTPQQIQLLQGQNTITASTGQISVTVNGVSGSIGSVQEQVNGLAEDVAEIKPLNYSTTEQATGRKWLNKPTYIVVIDMGEEKTVTSNTWYTVGNHLGAETIVNGMGISGSGGIIPMQIVEDINDGIKILQTRNVQVGVRYVWLEYTKTT